MIRNTRERAPRHIYPVDPWRIVERTFYRKFLPQTETIFSIGNGYLGMRGNFEEGRPVHQSGTYINGFHDTWPIVYGEDAYGFAKTGQTIVGVPDGRIIKLYVDDEPLYLPTADLLSFERALDMKNGVLDRSVVWETPSGKVVDIKSTRLVSFEHRHLAAIRYEVTVVNSHAPVLISSQLLNNEHDTNGNRPNDPRKAPVFKESPLAPEGHTQKGLRSVLSYCTRQSGMTLACGIEHVMETDCRFSSAGECDENMGKSVFTIDAEPKKPIRLLKYISYHSSSGALPRELRDRTGRTLDRAVRHGFDELVRSQRTHLNEFWHGCDIQVESDPEVTEEPEGVYQQAIRWNLFQIWQASARAEGVGIAAKGLTGQAYEGHYFWDMETYILPFLIYTEPRIARNVLRFRHSMLESARQRAKELNLPGALFPWRTINGEEASAYYAAGTAQFHINADIMFALRKYVDASGDIEFLANEGAEMLVETARMWVSHGFFNPKRLSKFCIHAVTGPDEYTAVVDNNTFTNLMARENLRFAAESVEVLRAEHLELYEELIHKTGFREEEAEAWRKAAENMFIPYDEEMGVHPQDEDFLEQPVWDFENTPKDHYPLLLHYHPLVIYRHQVIKQADVILAMFLVGNNFTEEQKRRNFDYYDPLTTGDSSLSACIESIVATEIGNMDKAFEYGREAILMDLADVGGNVADGCHIASMGGTWMVFVYGFAGMRDYGGHLSFKPRLPKAFRKISFPVRLRSRELVITLDRDAQTATYLMRSGRDELVITHYDESVSLEEGRPETRALRLPE